MRSFFAAVLLCVVGITNAFADQPEQGVASTYANGDGHEWSRTACGPRVNPNALTAAHRTLPCNTRVRVTNRHNHRSVVVRITDRGPYRKGRIIDLTPAAARAIGSNGLAHVSVAHEQIVSHPQGCPARAFCGCGASIEVFGRSIRELWLAANWLRFPPAQPAPGMVAVRRHHVFVIREVRGPGLVLAYDANSGGHRTRIHLRSLAGYSVRNPHAG